MSKLASSFPMHRSSGLTLISILVSISISSILFMAIAQLFALASISINTTISLNNMSNEMAKAIQALDSHVGDMAGLLMPNVNTIPERNIPTSVFVTQRETDPNHILYAIFRNPEFSGTGDDVVLKRSRGLIGFRNPDDGPRVNVALTPHNSPEIATCDGRTLNAGNVGINEFRVNGDQLICTAYHIPRADYSQYIDTNLASASDFNPESIPRFVRGPSITVANGVIGFKVLLRLASGPLGLGVNTYFNPTAGTPFWPSVRGISVGLILQGNPVPGQVQKQTSIFTQYAGTTVLNSTGLPGRRDNAMLSRIEKTISLKSVYIPGYTYSPYSHTSAPGQIQTRSRIKNSRYAVPVSPPTPFRLPNPSDSLLCRNSSGAAFEVINNSAGTQNSLHQSYFSGSGYSWRTGPPNWLTLYLNPSLFDINKRSLHTVALNSDPATGSGFFINNQPISFAIPKDTLLIDAQDTIIRAISTQLGPSVPLKPCGDNICIQPPPPRASSPFGPFPFGSIALASNGAGISCFDMFNLDLGIFGGQQISVPIPIIPPSDACMPFLGHWGGIIGPQQLVKQFGYAPPGQTINLIKDGNNPFRINSTFRILVTQIDASGLEAPRVTSPASPTVIPATGITVPGDPIITIPSANYNHLNELATHINAATNLVSAHVTNELGQQALRISPRSSLHGLQIESDGGNAEPVFSNYPLNTGSPQRLMTYGTAYNASSNVPLPCNNEGQSLWLY